MRVASSDGYTTATPCLVESTWAKQGVSPQALHWIDMAIAMGLLVAASPLLAAIALITWRLSRRSPLVAHTRVGRGGTPFRMLKFRTMWTKEAPESHERGWVQIVGSADVAEIKPKADPRVTSAFASWCRVHSIDELPQLWHVVRGEMSLVGPRPLVEAEVRRHYGEQSAVLLSLRPGMTGLWQVMGRNELTYRQRRRLDLFLVRHYCWGLYWKLLWRTVPRVLSGAGAW